MTFILVYYCRVRVIGYLVKPNSINHQLSARQTSGDTHPVFGLLHAGELDTHAGKQGNSGGFFCFSKTFEVLGDFAD